MVLLLDVKEWEALSLASYRRSNTFAAGSHTGGLFDWEQEAMQHGFPSAPAKILVLAAGGGREMLALMNQGYSAYGMDFNNDAIRSITDVLGTHEGYLGSRVGSFHQIVSDSTLLPPIAFDGIIIGWGAMSYAGSTENFISLLSQLVHTYGTVPILLSWNICQPRFELGRYKKFFSWLGLRSQDEASYLMPTMGPFRTYSEKAFNQIMRASNFKIMYKECAVEPGRAVIMARGGAAHEREFDM